MPVLSSFGGVHLSFLSIDLIGWGNGWSIAFCVLGLVLSRHPIRLSSWDLRLRGWFWLSFFGSISRIERSCSGHRAPANPLFASGTARCGAWFSGLPGPCAR